MNQRLNLFNAGFSATAPSHYYARLQMARELSAHEKEEVRNHMLELAQKLSADGKEFQANLETAGSVARGLDLHVNALPSEAIQYFKWLPEFVEQVERTFPMSKIDHYYFLFGRKLAEIMSNLRVAQYCLEAQQALNGQVDLTRKADKAMQDNEFILFKLIAPAALLSSEPRQHFFKKHYQELSQSWEELRPLYSPSINMNSAAELTGKLSRFYDRVEACYNDCVNRLTELGV